MADSDNPFDPENMIIKSPQGEPWLTTRCRAMLAQWDKEVAQNGKPSMQTFVNAKSCHGTMEDFIRSHPLPKNGQGR